MYLNRSEAYLGFRIFQSNQVTHVVQRVPYFQTVAQIKSEGRRWAGVEKGSRGTLLGSALTKGEDAIDYWSGRTTDT